MLIELALIAHYGLTGESETVQGDCSASLNLPIHTSAEYYRQTNCYCDLSDLAEH
jgi:hypothetical protein